MFHAQLPPPDYAFSPDVRGITWVDLVFPFFLFSMGAAFPFAMKKRISNGAGAAAISGWLVRRWLILVCFSFVLGNAGSASSSQCSPVWSNLFLIGTWGGLFLALTRFSFSKPAWNRAANAGGVLILAAAAVILQHALCVPLSKDKCDIIRANQDNTQRIIDTLNNHWTNEQAREIQDLKAVISQKEQTDILTQRFFQAKRYGYDGCGCGNGCGNGCGC